MQKVRSSFAFWDNMYYDFDLLKDVLHKYSLFKIPLAISRSTESGICGGIEKIRSAKP